MLVCFLSFMACSDFSVFQASVNMHFLAEYVFYWPNCLIIVLSITLLVVTGRFKDFCSGFKNVYAKVPKDIGNSEAAWRSFYLSIFILTFAFATANMFYNFDGLLGDYLFAIIGTTDQESLAQLTNNIFMCANNSNKIIAFGFTTMALFLPVRLNLY